MRLFVLALMIVLLPLRGWVSDAMATEMLSAGAMHLQIATNAVEDHAHQADVSQAMTDCAGQGAPEGTPDTDTHCVTCSVCQACHTVALLPDAAHSVAVVSSPALPYSPATVFASALVALGQKPPIS